jgi:hypothetical protein
MNRPAHDHNPLVGDKGSRPFGTVSRVLGPVEPTPAVVVHDR